MFLIIDAVYYLFSVGKYSMKSLTEVVVVEEEAAAASSQEYKICFKNKS